MRKTSDSPRSGAPGLARSGSKERTVHLLERARLGDRAAIDTLFARYLPRLRRWASGRLSRWWARDLSDTQDLVGETLLQTLKRVE